MTLPSALPHRPQRYRWIMILQSAAVLGLLISAIVIYLTLNDLRRSSNQYGLMRGEIDQTTSGLLEMQVALHNYVLSADPAFLSAYNQSNANVNTQLQELQATRMDSQAVASLRDATELWRREFAEQQIALVGLAQGASAQERYKAGSDQQSFARIREAARALHQQIGEQQAQLQQQIEWVDTTLLVIIVLLAAMVITWMSMFRRFLQREDRLWFNLSNTSAELTSSNAELQAKINESRLLSGIAEMFVTRRPADDLYPQIAKSVGQLINGWCAILLRKPHPHDETLQLMAIYHPHPDYLDRIRQWHTAHELHTTETVYTPLFSATEAAIVLNQPEAQRWAGDVPPELAAITDTMNLTAYVAVPIMVQGRVGGFVSIASTTAYLELEQQFFIGQIADQISLWLDNTRLFQLAEQRANELQTSFDSITDIIAIYDAQGQKLLLNQAGRRFIRVSDTLAALPKLLFRQPNGQMLPPDDHPVQRVLQGEVVHDIELAIPARDGRLVIHAVSVAPLRSAGDEIDGVVLVARDISARKELDRLKEEFVANMSHELRTPLTAILGYSELLLKRRATALTPWHLAKVEGIRAGGQRLLILVNDLLDTARLDAGQVELHRHMLNLNNLIEDQRSLLLPAFQAKQLQINVELAPQLPSIEIDPDRLTQVFTNLLSNAIKFTPEKGTIIIRSSHFMVVEQTPAVWIGPVLAAPIPFHAPGEHLIVSVSDSGIGITAEVMPSLWDRFYQAEGGSARRFGGTGLGLSIVKQLIELHGGQVWAVSPGLNQGSTFLLTLPITRAVYPPAMPYLEHSPIILMIEDDMDTASIFEQHLHEAGFNVVHARSGREGLIYAAQFQPAAITLDIGLPDNNGWDILVGLRQIQHLADTPVLIISAMDLSPLHLGLGVATYLSKPVHGDILITIIRKLLPQPALRGAAVLIVDDDPALVNLLEITLQEQGFPTNSATNGALALELLQADPLPGLILLDLMMPLVDGFQLLARIRADSRTQHIPVIVITARDLDAAEINQLRYATQAIQLKHNLDFDALVTEVQRHVIANGGDVHAKPGHPAG